jgi:hypothetical protein
MVLFSLVPSLPPRLVSQLISLKLQQFMAESRHNLFLNWIGFEPGAKEVDQGFNTTQPLGHIELLFYHPPLFLINETVFRIKV